MEETWKHSVRSWAVTEARWTTVSGWELERAPTERALGRPLWQGGVGIFSVGFLFLHVLAILWWFHWFIWLLFLCLHFLSIFYREFQMHFYFIFNNSFIWWLHDWWHAYSFSFLYRAMLCILYTYRTNRILTYLSELISLISCIIDSLLM